VFSVAGVAAAHGPRELLSLEPARAHVQWQIAQAMQKNGIRPGDKIAWVRPQPFTEARSYAWARLAQLQIIAEVPPNEERAFWTAGMETRQRVMDALRQTGARALVVTNLPAGEPHDGWKQIGDAGYFARFLND
jgi:hypothetical protein